MLTRILPIALILAPALALAQPAPQPPHEQMTPEQMQAVISTLQPLEANEHNALIQLTAQHSLDQREIAQLKAQVAAATAAPKKTEPVKDVGKKP